MMLLRPDRQVRLEELRVKYRLESWRLGAHPDTPLVPDLLFQCGARAHFKVVSPRLPWEQHWLCDQCFDVLRRMTQFLSATHNGAVSSWCGSVRLSGPIEEVRFVH